MGYLLQFIAGQIVVGITLISNAGSFAGELIKADAAKESKHNNTAKENAQSIEDWLAQQPGEVPESLQQAYFLSQLAKQSALSNLSDDFNIEGNSPLEAAQIIMLGENHAREEVILLNWLFILKHARPGDVILLESNEKVIDLNSFVLRALGLTDAEIAKANQLVNHLEKLNAWPLKGVHATGWDRHRPKIMKDISLKGLLMLPIAASHTIKNSVSTQGISKRNEALAEAMEKASCRRVFVVAGQKHVPFAPFTDELKDTFSAIEGTLAKHKYALVRPKIIDDRSTTKYVDDAIQSAIRATINLYFVAQFSNLLQGNALYSPSAMLFFLKWRSYAEGTGPINAADWKYVDFLDYWRAVLTGSTGEALFVSGSTVMNAFLGEHLAISENSYWSGFVELGHLSTLLLTLLVQEMRYVAPNLKTFGKWGRVAGLGVLAATVIGAWKQQEVNLQQHREEGLDLSDIEALCQ